MGKFYGRVGYAIPREQIEIIDGEQVHTDIWKDEIVERKYDGELMKVVNKWQNGYNINDNATNGNQMSIVADPFAYQHFNRIKYVEYMGVLWKVTSVEPQRPRLILTVGGEWNGQKASAT